MSVLIPDMVVFQYIENGLVYAANNGTIDDRFSEYARAYFQKKDVNVEAKRVTKNLLLLVNKSYAAHYREKIIPSVDLYYKSATHFVKGCQLLKYLQCVRYQIEVHTIEHGYSEVDPNRIIFVLSDQDKADIKLLDKMITDLAFSIVNQITEFKNAKWSD